MLRIAMLLLGLVVLVSGCAGQTSSGASADQQTCISNGGIWHDRLGVCEHVKG
jgi:hypothetical protein